PAERFPCCGAGAARGFGRSSRPRRRRPGGRLAAPAAAVDRDFAVVRRNAAFRGGLAPVPASRVEAGVGLPGVLGVVFASPGVRGCGVQASCARTCGGWRRQRADLAAVHRSAALNSCVLAGRSPWAEGWPTGRLRCWFPFSAHGLPVPFFPCPTSPDGGQRNSEQQARVHRFGRWPTGYRYVTVVSPALRAVVLPMERGDGMGRHVTPNRSFKPLDRQRYRDKMQRGLDALARMLADGNFSFPRQQMGLEMELCLVDEHMEPSMSNHVVLEKINDSSFTTELGQQNIELNVEPQVLAGDSAVELEQRLHASMSRAASGAHDAGAKEGMIGTLPTLRDAHFDPQWLSRNPRYSILNEQIFLARGEEMLLDMEGVPLGDRAPERLRSYADSILPESACTSVQLHLQVAPEDFASHWNAAQCLAGVQVAVGANSPFLLGKALWHETR